MAAEIELSTILNAPAMSPEHAALVSARAVAFYPFDSNLRRTMLRLREIATDLEKR